MRLGFRKAGSGEGLLVTEAKEERRFAFQLPEDRLEVIVTLEPHAHDRTLAEVVVSGIPSRSEPLGDALLEAVRPRAIVISASEVPAQSGIRKSSGTLSQTNTS